LITSGKEKFWRRLRDLKALTNIKIAIEWDKSRKTPQIFCELLWLEWPENQHRYQGIYTVIVWFTQV
jgi:hypothetical protein